MKKSLSWKVLLLLTVVFGILSVVLGGIIGNFLSLLAVILGTMGVIALFRSFGKSTIKTGTENLPNQKAPAHLESKKDDPADIRMNTIIAFVLIGLLFLVVAGIIISVAVMGHS